MNATATPLPALEGGEVERPLCPLCGVDEADRLPWAEYHLNLLEPLGVSQCRRCGLIYLCPRPDAESRLAIMRGEVTGLLRAYSAAEANYAAVTRSREEKFRHRMELLESLAGACRGEPRSLLDIGASSGTLVMEARRRGWEAHGLEPSASGVAAAMSDGVPLAQGLAEALPFRDASFDVAHSNHVFEHLANPLAAAREAFRVLKPGGLVFIEVPNQFDNVHFQRDALLRRVHQRERNARSIHHLYFFSRRSLANLLRLAGFEQVRVRDIYLSPAPGALALVSHAMRLVGRFLYGGPIVQAVARKPEERAA